MRATPPLISLLISPGVGRLIGSAFAAGLLLGTLLLGAAGAAEPDGARSPLTRRLDRLMERKPLAEANVGMLVVRASDGSTVYARGADRLLIPASNQKILTALASLARFGPTHRFVTRIWADVPLDAEGVVGELLVEGAGDPAMNSEDWWRVAARLRLEGLRGVRGRLRVDDTRFEPPGWHPSWGRTSARAYHAPVGALTANYGTFMVSIWPRDTVGLPARVELDPPVGYLRIRNQTMTSARNVRPRLSVERVPGRSRDGALEEVVSVDGVVRIGDPGDTIPRSVLDPGLYAGSLLAHQLAANDVFVEGDVLRSPRGADEMTLLLSWPGRTVAEAVQLCMKYSNNSIAETLVKNLAVWHGVPLDGDPARQGEWVIGVRALRAQLEALGIDLGDARLIDGSGLSTKNRLSPRTIVEALEVGRKTFGFGAEFVASMPIAELDGTLEERLEGERGRIRAKTGLLGDASATSLSGYADRGDGERLVFSILVNGYSGDSGSAMDAVDGLAAALLDTPIADAEKRAPRP